MLKLAKVYLVICIFSFCKTEGKSLRLVCEFDTAIKRRIVVASRSIGLSNGSSAVKVSYGSCYRMRLVRLTRSGYVLMLLIYDVLPFSRVTHPLLLSAKIQRSAERERRTAVSGSTTGTWSNPLLAWCDVCRQECSPTAWFTFFVVAAASHFKATQPASLFTSVEKAL